MAALLGMIARPAQPKSTPAVIAMATIAASQLKLPFPLLRCLGGVLSWHREPCVQRLRSPSPFVWSNAKLEAAEPMQTRRARPEGAHGGDVEAFDDQPDGWRPCAGRPRA